LTDKAPLVFTLTVDGTPILTFAADNAPQARELAREQWLRDELGALSRDGAPICHAKSKLAVRSAQEDERLAYAEGAKSDPANDDVLLVYLIDLGAAARRR
jgi:hypothetical protein